MRWFLNKDTWYICMYHVYVPYVLYVKPQLGHDQIGKSRFHCIIHNVSECVVYVTPLLKILATGLQVCWLTGLVAFLWFLETPLISPHLCIIMSTVHLYSKTIIIIMHLDVPIVVLQCIFTSIRPLFWAQAWSPHFSLPPPTFSESLGTRLGRLIPVSTPMPMLPA